jgi:hypothetical protein
VDAVLADAPLGVFIDLMERSTDGQILRGAIVDAEARADRLALHLLAPWNAVRPYLPETVGETQRLTFAAHAQAALQDVFGLPESVAREYAVRLWSRLHRPDTRAWLGL